MDQFPSPSVRLGPLTCLLPAPSPLAGRHGTLRFLTREDLLRSSSPISHFQDGKAGQRGKETCPRAPSRCLGTLEVAPSPPPSRPTFLCHLDHTPPPPPSSLGLLQFLTSSLHPASSPAQACLSPHLSPGLLSHCCLGFLLPAPEARGVSPPSLWPMLSSLSWALPSCPGAPPGMGLPLPFHLLLSSKRG